MNEQAILSFLMKKSDFDTKEDVTSVQRLTFSFVFELPMRMLTLLITIAFALLILPTRAQDSCACAAELEWVMGYYERNLPGFTDNVTPDNQRDYEAFKAELKGHAKAATDKVTCFKTMVRYVEFFRDNHSRITMSFPRVDESQPEQVTAFQKSETFLGRESFSLETLNQKQYPQDDIRGHYQTVDSVYSILIVPDPAGLTTRDYVGVITDARTPLWQPGQVKMELKRKPTGGFEGYVYMRNHSVVYFADLYFRKGHLGEGWFKTTVEDMTDHRQNLDFTLHSKVLNDSTYYLRIPTFSSSWSARIDSFYEATKADCERYPYLIVDVRNNGGGSDDNVMPLLNLIYTRPFQSDVVELYATEDNLKRWEEWTANAKADKVNYTKSDVRWFEGEVKKIRNAKPGTFVSRSKGRLVKWKVRGTQPKKVAVICNRNCASSCETLLFWTKESENTILVGENSGGYVGYGEVGQVSTPCYQYSLYCTMTRYLEQRKYEVVGIAPDYRLDPESDWIEQTLQLMK